MQKIIYIEKQREISDLNEECYILNSALNRDFCEHFIAQATALDKIVLFYGDEAVACCKELKADGIIVDLGADDLKDKISALRKELGKNKYIGLFTRNRKHESMLVSEAEPDFIIFKVWKEGFEQVKELTDWYQEFFIIQSAAWVMEEGVTFEELRTDFVIKK